jgi:hypothetical protein
LKDEVKTMKANDEVKVDNQQSTKIEKEEIDS